VINCLYTTMQAKFLQHQCQRADHIAAATAKLDKPVHRFEIGVGNELLHADCKHSYVHGALAADAHSAAAVSITSVSRNVSCECQDKSLQAENLINCTFKC
jgi:hypothetical protein